MVSHADSCRCFSPTGESLQSHAVHCGICIAQAKAAVGYLVNVAANVGRTSALFEVAVQSGCCGYLAAVDRYRPSTGTPFCAFACGFIKGAIMRGIGDELEPLCRGERLGLEATESFEGSDLDPSSGMDALDIFSAVRRFIDLLPLGLRHVARAIVIEGLSQAQAARAHGMSRTAVMKKMRQVFSLAVVDLAEYASAN